MIEISNGVLTAQIGEQGAELASLRRLDFDHEFIWNADARYWGRHAPILFPIVGKVWDGHYRVGGKEYSLPQHGFARDMEFTVLCRQPDSVALALQSTPQTLEKYPFPFRLEVVYRLEDNKLISEWNVKNIGSTEMYFQIGAHPGFNLPDYDPTDFIHGYFRLLSNGEPVQNLVTGCLTEQGYRSDSANMISLDTDAFLPVTPGLFARDAIVLEEYQTDCVELYDKYGSQLLSLECPDAPVWGLWSPPAKNAPFVCIEPWQGRCDLHDYSGSIEGRDYIQQLPSGRTRQFEYTISL